jgi:hypothetical protein
MEEDNKNNQTEIFLSRPDSSEPQSNQVIHYSDQERNNQTDVDYTSRDTRKTVTVELNRHGCLYTYPGSELLAKTHSKTCRIGEYQENYERKCECCKKNIPTLFYNMSHPLKPKDLMKYGIDLVNFFLLVKEYYKYIVLFYLSYLLQFLICLLFFGVPELNFNFLYIELYYQTIIYGGYSGLNYQIIIDNVFNLIRIGCVFYVYLKIQKKYKKYLRLYKKKLYDEIYVDESIYSIFIKNLPKTCTSEELKNFLLNEYGVNSIREIILLKNVENLAEKFEYLQLLISQKKKMEVTNSDMKYQVKDFEEVELEINKTTFKIRSLIEDAEKDSKIFSGTAIVIFEKNDEKNLFFRKNHHLGTYCLLDLKKPHIFKGKKIYFESIPSLQNIDWKHVNYSLEKTLSGNTLNSILSIVIFFIFSGLIFAVTYFASIFEGIYIKNYNLFKFPFVRAIFLIVINIILEKIIILILSVFYIPDKYFKNVLFRYIIMQKTFFNTIVINILIYHKKLAKDFELQYLSFIYFLVLLCLKNLFFTRFSETYFKNKLKYFFLTKIMRRKLIQMDMNNLYSDNEFNVITVFEKYRLLVLSAIFLIKLYPLCAVFIISCVFVHYYIIKWSLFHSELKEVNYYGYYFNIIMRSEAYTLVTLILLMSFTAISVGDMLPNVLFFLVSDIFNVLNFRNGFNPYNIDKDYSEMQHKFQRNFHKEQFVDLNLLKNNLDN